jgi:hypothetical protein
MCFVFTILSKFDVILGGRYNISYTVKDEQGRLAMSFYDNLYIAGGSGK